MTQVSFDVFDMQGKKVDTINVPSLLFDQKENDALVHQVYTIKRSNQRSPYAHTKTRADVKGGGRKPWRQKGTGRARHGSIRSPLWVGGGVTFGPRNNKKFIKKINAKMNKKAIAVVLSSKAKDNAVVVVDSLAFEKPSTKQAVAVLNGLKKDQSSVVVFGTGDDSNFTKSFRNVERVTPLFSNRVNIVDLLHHKNCIFSKSGLQSLIKNYADTNQHTPEVKQQKGSATKPNKAE